MNRLASQVTHIDTGSISWCPKGGGFVEHTLRTMACLVLLACSSEQTVGSQSQGLSIGIPVFVVGNGNDAGPPVLSDCVMEGESVLSRSPSASVPFFSS